MKHVKYLFICLLLIHCSSNDVGEGSQNGETPSNPENPDNGGSANNDWLIPINEVRDGGPGKDGIPSIDNPKFNSVTNADASLNEDDLVVIIKRGDIVKIYPHFILDYHEVVNDVFDTEAVTLSYCPLTGTAFAWRSQVNGAFSSFGVSGLLYNANLILYDRNTDSNWSQILELCVNGESIGLEPEKIQVVESEWGVAKSVFPNAEVLTTETGFERPYGSYPYGAYLDDDDFFLFTPSIINPSLPNKERVLCIRDDDQAKVYQLADFNNGQVITDNFQGRRYVVAGNSTVLNAFLLNGSQSSLEFTFESSNEASFFSDNEGNHWNLFGEAISGPRTGTQLQPANSFMSMWFAVAAFFPDPEIF